MYLFGVARLRRIVGVDLRVHPYSFDRLPSINSGQAGQVGPILRDTPMGIGAPQDVGPYINALFGMKYFSTNQQLAIFLIIVCLFGLFLWQEQGEKDPRAEGTHLLPEGEIYVEVLGDVQKEGIYCFSMGVTVGEAVAEAGGMAGRMALAEDISSQKISNGSKLIVSRGEGALAIIKIRRMEPEKLLIYSIPIELNRATKEELVALPGIGEILAARIIEYRRAKWGFSSLEELMEVKGIGRKKYERLRSFICLH